MQMKKGPEEILISKNPDAENRYANSQKQKEQQSRTNWNIRPYLAIGLTAFIVLGCSIVLYFFIARYDGASANIEKVISVLQPIIIGAIIAYLLNPMVNTIQGWLEKLADDHFNGNEKLKKSSRTIGVFIAMIIMLFVISIVLRSLIPQLYETVQGLAVTLPTQANNTSDWIQSVLEENKLLAEYADNIIKQGTESMEAWLKSELLPQSKEIITSVTSGILVFVKGIINFIIGLIVCIYLLLEKDHFVGAGKKLTYGLFTAKAANNIVRVARKSNQIFSGFIGGKIIDSVIVGILCYIVLIIVHMPYALLVSCIVGVTNVVPFFGPYIGAIPSFCLILLESPPKAVYFAIIILILQQVDGNIIGPKILGQSTGLSSFWVVFAILLSGGLFGFVGMLFGVPVFAVIYYVFNEAVKNKLKHKRMPINSKTYVNVEYLDEDTRKLVYMNRQPYNINRLKKDKEEESEDLEESEDPEE
ncbi:MAG: AI-2E family transporter [Lachnospiraceae bacterium]|nr:AI-2E family transporter [Lachnospiraceae bacterium]